MNLVIAAATWWALPAAFAYFALGALWFTPLFGRAWDRSIGHDRSQDNGRFPTSYYVTPFITAVVTTIVMSLLIQNSSATGAFGAGAVVGAGIGLAIAAASFTNALTPHTPRPFTFATITGGYHLVACIITGTILGALS
ncbi:DUF1761 domain-containing protein [Salinibacterium sp. NG253]|uniref:DUF1761 domain-containing protein n=1 Tax=Salinibacterium sp. NG253 TaxID=2792039 RepID=UPI0018CD4923|nr:DUF1761 domain-containing protein [Salinibacterium sp. NG253]MBH0117301.1 DUF1761 domain-containing protein [Salinibacterium sp. NG253]